MNKRYLAGFEGLCATFEPSMNEYDVADMLFIHVATNTTAVFASNVMKVINLPL